MDTNSDLSNKPSVEELVEKYANGEIKAYEIEKHVNPNKAAEIRLKGLEKKYNKRFDNLKVYSILPQNCGPNIENMIGAIQVPLGIAGPVKIKGEYSIGEFHIPLSTTEGTLVASVNRGCSVINKSGGAKVVILKSGQTRSVLFKSKSVIESKKFVDWVKENIDLLKKEAKAEERFIEIDDIETFILGTTVWLRLIANTNDAMGMNMVTIAGKRIGDYISENYSDIEFVSESGNMCIDKKPSALTMIKGRGKKVSAEVMIPNKVIEKYLKTTAEKLIDLNYRKNMLGSAMSGSLGYNAHFANIVAAMFLATGQDMAHTVDGSIGFTTIEKVDDGVLFGVTISSLQVGTVGGGTGVATQKECLDLLGVAGPGEPTGDNSKKLAEIVATAVLAGEISLLGAQAAKHLTRAHLKHNR
ncbi:hydroxymethylglutaryl-CoA reductase (NADPH) [archaeon]|jgi:hydroxymethylglutaryl-CoA reductase (NADPH)|nr:hydroxymethylglutaryl-CoA reductase (NADPH) [archaeon]MBT7391361.1 hydroxymethylglutaryl-CoA reductase (NADPH) [archaeon]